MSNLIGSEIVAGGDNIRAALPDVIGQTIGGMVAGRLARGGSNAEDIAHAAQMRRLRENPIYADNGDYAITALDGGYSNAAPRRSTGFFQAIGDWLGMDGSFGYDGPNFVPIEERFVHGFGESGPVEEMTLDVVGRRPRQMRPVSERLHDSDAGVRRQAQQEWADTHTGYADAMGNYYPGTGSLPGNNYNPIKHPRATAGLMAGTLAAPYVIIYGGTMLTTSGSAMAWGGGIGGGVQTLDETLRGQLDTPEAWARIGIATGGGALTGGSGGVIANQIGGRTVMAIGGRAFVNGGMGAVTGIGQAELNARISSGWEYGATQDDLLAGAAYGGGFAAASSGAGDLVGRYVYRRFGSEAGDALADRYEALRWAGLDTNEILMREGAFAYSRLPSWLQHSPSVYGVTVGGAFNQTLAATQPPLKPVTRWDVSK